MVLRYAHLLGEHLREYVSNAKSETNLLHCYFEQKKGPVRMKSYQAFIYLALAWCPGAESNRRHEDFQSSALPTELPGPAKESLLFQLSF